MSCGCKKRKHPIQQPTPSTIRLTEVTKKPEPKPLNEQENKIVQKVVEELQKLNNK